MADYIDVVTRKSIDSDVIRVYPGALVQLYTQGTGSLIASATADANGVWSIASLPTGFYDIKVDAALVRTIHFVKYDHVHNDEVWQVFHSGAITADSEAVNTEQTFGSDVAGTLVRVKVLAHNIDATGNVVVHILKKAKDGAANLTVASNSAWSYTVNPGAIRFGFMHVDNAPAVSVAADEILQMGLDWTANAVEGLTLVMVFRPT